MREVEGWQAAPYQWATAGYMGAIETGKTICGFLFGGSVYLGYLNGMNATEAPEVKDKKRKQAITSVRDLFQGFIERFGHTDCQALTGCDWSKREDIKRYFKDQVYKNICYHQFEYVLANCLEKMTACHRGK